MKKLHTYLLLALLAVFAQPTWAGKAINFSLTDSKGKVLRLSDYSGKWLLVNFWAPWCPRCKMEFPLLNDLDARKDVVVLGMVMDYGLDENSVHSAISRFNCGTPRFWRAIGGIPAALHTKSVRSIFIPPPTCMPPMASW